ncbi:exodeoxyribonuclease VII small subunit [Verrucomicrobiaceae bacterium 227]
MPPKKSPAKKPVAASFEEAAEELEEITRRLERDPSSLTSLLDDFERGQALLQFCQATLKSARKRLDLMEANLHAEPDNTGDLDGDTQNNDADHDDDDVRLF